MSTWMWNRRTTPFVNRSGREPARFILEQVDDDHFAVHHEFTYEPEGANVHVDSKSLIRTDLASIPLFLAWFVPVNGRHTPAALVHDQLVDESKRPAADPDARADADDVFLRALGQCGVPILRRHVMFTAVTAATRWTRGWASRLALVLWGLLSVAGTVLLLRSVARGEPAVAAVCAVAPVPGGVLWGRRNFWQGVLAGYAVWVVAVPAAASAVAYGVYWVAEQVVRIVVPRVSSEVDDAPPPAPLR